MERFSIVCIGIALIAAVTADDQTLWDWFKSQHGKNYQDVAEELARMENFMNNLQEIADHNELYESGAVRYKKGINKYSDMSDDEFHGKMHGYRLNDDDWCASHDDDDDEPTHVVPNGAVIPKSIDWRDKGAVTPVKEQGHCNVCWAYSSCGALEAAHFLKTGDLIPLSEQNLLDCTYEDETKCYIGTYRTAYDYIESNGGIDTAKSYPYTEKKQECKYNPKHSAATVRGRMRIACGNETALTHALATVGPVTVAINARLIHHYKSGVFSDPDCTQNMNHEVLAVGYGSNDDDGDYYIIKNSWGTSWGEDGYLKLARNKGNLCGVANDAGYPLV